MDISKRNFLKLGSVPLLVLLSSGTVSAQEIKTDNAGFQRVAIYYGDISNRPDPETWNNKKYYAYIYITTDGGRYWITQDENQWQQLKFKLPEYAENELPEHSDSVAGQIAFNTSIGRLTAFDGHHWHTSTTTSGAITSPVTVANTTTETLIWDYTLDPDTLIKGRTFELMLSGVFSTASTDDTVTINVYLDGALIATVSNVGKNVTDAPWHAITNFTIRSEGTNGQVHPHVVAKFANENGDDDEGTQTVDTTVTETLEAYAQWNNAKADNSVTLDQGYLKEL